MKKIILIFFVVLNFAGATTIDDFFYEVKSGHVDCVKSIIKKVNVNSKDVKQWTALNIALYNNDFEMVELLLKNGANPKILAPDNQNSIFRALKAGKYDLADRFIKSGVDINFQNNGDETALLWAIRIGDNYTRDFLLERGANPNIVSPKGKSPLSLAMENNVKESIYTLIKKGANLKDKNIIYQRDSIERFFSYLTSGEKKQIAELGFPLDYRFFEGSSLLMKACHVGDLDFVKYLISKGIDVNYANDSGTTALINAIKEKKVDILKYLLDNGADFLKETKAGENAVDIALATGTVEILNILYTKVQTIDFTNLRWSKSVYRILSLQNYEKLEYLCTKTNFLKFKDSEGDNLLNIAIENKMEKLTSFFIENGLDIEEPNSKRERPIIQAIKNNNYNIVKALIDGGAKLDDTLHLALKNNIDIAILLIDNGVDIEVKDSQGKTPLLFAVENNLLDLARNLVYKGSNIEAVNNKNLSLLQIASEKGYEEMALYLLNKGAKFDKKDSIGETVLSKAIRLNMNNLVQELINKGIDINVKNSYGETPLIIAAENNNKNLVKLLIDKGANLDLKTNNGKTALDIAKDKRFLAIERLLMN